MFNDVPDEELMSAVDGCVADVLWETAIEEPPVDARAVARRLGLVVTSDERLPCRARFVSLRDSDQGRLSQGTIVVGPADRPEREQWAVAHEIGESIAHRVFERLAVRPQFADPSAREFVANRVAQSLLLPRSWFAADGREVDWDLLELKHRYATASHELIARRMLEMTPPIVITICDQGHVKWRRGNASSRPPRLVPEELDIWQRTQVTGLPMEESLDATATGLERVRCWPVHEPGWKREILRSDIAEWNL